MPRIPIPPDACLYSMKASNDVLSFRAFVGSGAYSILISVIILITPPINLLRAALAYSRFFESGTKKLNGICEFCPRCGYKKDTLAITESHVILCPECKKEIDADSKFCSYCGHKIIPKPPKIQEIPKPKRQLPQCPNCKRDVANTSEQCPYCGHKLIPKKPPEESYLIKCPNCSRDIVGTSVKCPYCGFRLKPLTFNEEVDKEKSAFEEFQEGCAGCNKSLFQFGCGMTLLMALIGLLLLVLGIL